MSNEQRTLTQLLEQELTNPADYQKFIAEISRLLEDKKSVLESLLLKDKHHKLIYYLDSQKLWLKLIGIRLIKALMVTGVILAVLSVIIFGENAFIYLSASFVGMVFLYFIYMFLISREIKSVSRRVKELNLNYRSQIEDLLEGLK
ncbi:MAG: hypothetical protein HY606_15505 [Planctomycetes bacterium]|nr:hypothetical protein [Planctomycetota bacterium]